MSLLDQTRREALIQLACKRFDPEITDAELQVLRDSASSVDPDIPDKDASRPTIRPDFLRWLATDKDAAQQIDPKGLRVYGFTIPGSLELQQCHIAAALDFCFCTFEGEINLMSAETQGICLFNCDSKYGVSADQAKINGPFFLKASTFTREISILGAKITGQLNCRGAKLTVKEGDALAADNAEICGDVVLDEQFESAGTISFHGAKITGQLNCRGAKLRVKEGTNALFADGAEIVGDVFLDKQEGSGPDEGFESTGAIRFPGAKITGQLNCRGAKLRVKEGTDALVADRAEIGGSVFLDEQFESTGAIRFPGAKITGGLSCSGAKLRVQEGTNALVAQGAEIGGDVFLDKQEGSGPDEGFESTGAIRFLGAKITGQLSCRGAKLRVKEGTDALAADGAEIVGDVFLDKQEGSGPDEGFESTGTIRFPGAKITGQLNCSGAKLTPKQGDALDAENAEIGGSVFLDEQFESTGAIRFPGAKITGGLSCSGAKLRVQEGTNALVAQGAEIGGGVFLDMQEGSGPDDGFESTGTIRFHGAKITGQLSCRGAKLRVKEGTDALAADNAEIVGDVFLDEQFESTGTISLPGAKITGGLSCSGAKLRVKEGTDALFADGAEIGGGVFLDMQEGSGPDDGFESTGTIRFHGAKITGGLSCRGAKLRVKEGTNALAAQGAEIGGGVFLDKQEGSGPDDGFESTGTISLPGAKITGHLGFDKSSVAEVICWNLDLTGDLFWRSIQVNDKTSLDLRGAKVKCLRDDEGSWPSEGKLYLDGFVYEDHSSYLRQTAEEISNSAKTVGLHLKVEERIEWLKRQPTEPTNHQMKPQPWMQLAKLLEAKGDRKDAKHVVYRFRRLRAEQKCFDILKLLLGLILTPLKFARFLLTPWKSIPLTWPYLRHPNRSWSIAFAWLEEAPLRILYTITISVLLGTHIFAGAEYQGAMIQSTQIQPNAIDKFDEKSKEEKFKPVSIYYPKFQPFIYALENAIPLVKLGMDDKWTPNPIHTPKLLYPNIRWLNWLSFPNSYWFLMGTRWVLILTGWVQATIFVAAVADRFKK